MYLRSSVVTSAAVFALTGLFALFYPPGLLRERQTYVGGPVSDKDLDLRLEASDKFGYIQTDDDAWESTSEGCGFRYNYNTQTGVFGNVISLDHGRLCIQEKALDLYAVQGIEKSMAYEDFDAANDTSYIKDGLFAWIRFAEREDLLRHTFNLGTVNLTTLGVSKLNLTTWEVEGLLEIVDIRGPYTLANTFNVCKDNGSGGFQCLVKFDFWNSPFVIELSSASEGKELAAAELDSLVKDGKILEGESSAAAQAICNSYDSRVVECDIECTLHYPYSSSVCSGTIEIERIGNLPYSMLLATISFVLSLAVIFLTPLKACVPECNRKYGRPQINAEYVSGGTSFLSQRGPSNSGSQSTPVQVGTIGGVNMVAGIPLISWPGCVALLQKDGVRSIVKVSDNSVVLAFILLETGTVRNATISEAIAMLEPAQRREFEGASRNTNFIEWTSGFSIYHCVSCIWMYGVLTHIAVVSRWGAFYWLLALFTYTGFNQETSLGTVVRACRFRGRVLPYSTRGEEVILPTLLGGAQLWYDLGLPNGGALSWGIFVVVVVAVTANAMMVTFVHQSFPTADSTEGITRNSFSVEDAVELCRKSGSRFGMAGDWVERSRCGDISGRTALMTSLARVVPDGRRRLGHVYDPSQTSWAASERGGPSTNEYGYAPQNFADLGVEEHKVRQTHGRAIMVCAGFEEADKPGPCTV